MTMESNHNVPDSLYDDISSHSSPYFLDPPSVTPATLFENVYTDNSGMLQGWEGMHEGLGDSFGVIAANSSSHSTQYSQGTLYSAEVYPGFSGIDVPKEVDELPCLDEPVTGNVDQTALPRTQTHIRSDEPYYQESYAAESENGLTNEQLDMQDALAYQFSMCQPDAQSATGTWYLHDNLDGPPSELAVLNMSHPNDEPTHCLSEEEEESSPEIRNDDANRRKRHPRTKSGYQCDICAKAFDLHRDMTRHKQQHLKNLTCDKCPATFSAQRDLERHTRCVHDRNRTYVCLVCNKSFGRKDNMRRHLKVHQEAIS